VILVLWHPEISKGLKAELLDVPTNWLLVPHCYDFTRVLGCWYVHSPALPFHLFLCSGNRW
jgi:hypothetical protein